LVAADIKEKAKECVTEAADVVIIGCNGLAPLCTAAKLNRLEQGNIPIVDCVAVGLKTAEMVVDLKDNLGLPFIARTGFYALPREKDLRRVRATFGLETL
jgi:Asp/Glu/hydantoin racemase